MLVLALEFSRGPTARALPTSTTGVRARTGRVARPSDQRSGRASPRDDQMAAPSKRKSEVRRHQ
jgi:hypothetical protein